MLSVTLVVLLLGASSKWQTTSATITRTLPERATSTTNTKTIPEIATMLTPTLTLAPRSPPDPPELLHVTDGNSFNNLTFNASSALVGDVATWKGFSGWAAVGITDSGSGGYGTGTIINGQLWMPPHGTNFNDVVPLVSMDLETGAMKKYSWPSGFIPGRYPFSGGAYDGTYLWLVPHRANQVLKVDPTDGSMTGYDSHNDHGSYQGVSLDKHGCMWMTPHYSRDNNGVRRMDLSTGTMVDFDNGPTGFSWNFTTSPSTDTHPLSGACFDGTYHWMAPYSGGWVVGVNTDSPSTQMTGFKISGWSAKGVGLATGQQFSTATITDPGSQAIWLTPASARSIVHLNTSTGSVTAYNNWPSGVTSKWFVAALFDGKHLWLCSMSQMPIVRFDPLTGAMKAFTEHRAWGFGGISFDPMTKALYFLPKRAPMIIRLTTGSSGGTATTAPAAATHRSCPNYHNAMSRTCCSCLSDEYPGDWDNGHCCGHCTAVCGSAATAPAAPATPPSPSSTPSPTASPTAGAARADSGASPQQEGSTTVIVVVCVVCGSIVLIVVAIVVACVWRKKHDQQARRDQRRLDFEEQQRDEEDANMRPAVQAGWSEELGEFDDSFAATTKPPRGQTDEEEVDIIVEEGGLAPVVGTVVSAIASGANRGCPEFRTEAKELPEAVELGYAGAQ